MTQILANKKNYQSGQSIVEIVIALALFSIFAISIVIYCLGSFKAVNRSSEHIQALAYAQEGLEAIRNIKSRTWNELVFDQTGVADNNGTWQLTGENETDILDQFRRTIRFDAVYRDEQNNPVDEDQSGAQLDPLGKDVTVIVSWNFDNSASTSIELKERMTAWENK
jgi:type II secretory pathway pseudopilin PulG